MTEIIYTAPLNDFMEFDTILTILMGGKATDKFRITKTLFTFLKDHEVNPIEFLTEHFSHLKTKPMSLKSSIFNKNSEDIWFERTGNIFTACFADER